jgi:hypothetical protein
MCCRITIHNASWDYAGKHPRHGTRVTSLGEKPFFKADAPTRRQALGLLDESEKAELEEAISGLSLRD